MQSLLNKREGTVPRQASAADCGAAPLVKTVQQMAASVVAAVHDVDRVAPRDSEAPTVAQDSPVSSPPPLRDHDESEQVLFDKSVESAALACAMANAPAAQQVSSEERRYKATPGSDVKEKLRGALEKAQTAVLGFLSPRSKSLVLDGPGGDSVESRLTPHDEAGCSMTPGVQEPQASESRKGGHKPVATFSPEPDVVNAWHEFVHRHNHPAETPKPKSESPKPQRVQAVTPSRKGYGEHDKAEQSSARNVRDCACCGKFALSEDVMLCFAPTSQQS